MAKPRHRILIDYCLLYDRLEQQYPDAWQADEFCEAISRVIHSTYQDWQDAGFSDQQFYDTFVETDLIAWMIFNLRDLSEGMRRIDDAQFPEDPNQPEPTKEELKRIFQERYDRQTGKLPPRTEEMTPEDLRAQRDEWQLREWFKRMAKGDTE